MIHPVKEILYDNLDLMQNTYFQYFHLKCTKWKFKDGNQVHCVNILTVGVHFSESLETWKKVTQQPEEKRLPQKIRFNCLQTFPKLYKPTHFRKLQLGTFLPSVFTFIIKIFPKWVLLNFVCKKIIHWHSQIFTLLVSLGPHNYTMKCKKSVENIYFFFFLEWSRIART